MKKNFRGILLTLWLFSSLTALGQKETEQDRFSKKKGKYALLDENGKKRLTKHVYDTLIWVNQNFIIFGKLNGQVSGNLDHIELIKDIDREYDDWVEYENTLLIERFRDSLSERMSCDGDKIYSVNGNIVTITCMFYGVINSAGEELNEMAGSIKSYENYKRNIQFGDERFMLMSEVPGEFEPGFLLQLFDRNGVIKEYNSYSDVSFFFLEEDKIFLKDFDASILSPDGEIIVEGIRDPEFLLGKTIRYKEGKKHGIMDYHGNILLSPEYDFIETPFHGDMLIVEKHNKYGLINNQYKEVVAPEFSIIYKGPGSYFYFCKDCEVKIERPSPSCFCSGEFFHTGNSYGLIDNDGNIVVPGIYTKPKSENDRVTFSNETEKLTFDVATGESQVESLTGLAQRKGKIIKWLKLKQQEWQLGVGELKGTEGICLYADGGGLLHFTDNSITAECDSADMDYEISIDWSIITKIFRHGRESIGIYCRESKILILTFPEGTINLTDYEQMLEKLRLMAEISGAILEK